MKNKKVISDKELNEIAIKFTALGELMRLKILRLLMSGEMSVGDISKSLFATQTNISRHLRKLSDAKLVSCRKEGTFMFYSINDKNLIKICKLMCGVESD